MALASYSHSFKCKRRTPHRKSPKRFRPSPYRKPYRKPPDPDPPSGWDDSDAAMVRLDTYSRLQHRMLHRSDVMFGLLHRIDFESEER